MRRLLAVCTLAVAPLLAATPAAAATQHVVDSGCTDYPTATLCFKMDYKVTNVITPSGNRISHAKGSNSYVVTFLDGSGYGDTYDFDTKYFYKDYYQEQVLRIKAAHTYYNDNSSCTDFTYYKFTNGKVQIENYETICDV